MFFQNLAPNIIKIPNVNYAVKNRSGIPNSKNIRPINQEKNQSIETGPQRTEMMELSSKELTGVL